MFKIVNKKEPHHDIEVRVAKGANACIDLDTTTKQSRRFFLQIFLCLLTVQLRRCLW